MNYFDEYASECALLYCGLRIDFIKQINLLKSIKK